MITDNGPCFIGKPYAELMKQTGVLHKTSSPHHPKSHGFVERMIQSVKQLMKKSAKDYYDALLVYRTTPLSTNMPSPSEIVFGRKLQANLPIVVQGPNNDTLREMREEAVKSGILYHDKHSKKLETLRTFKLTHQQRC
jgi:transposase InsO family protein